MSTKQILRSLRARQKEMAILRDKLRDLEDEIIDESERVQSALVALDECIALLSESV